MAQIKSESGSEVAQSCPTLCHPTTVAHQAPLSMGFSKEEYWSGLPLLVSYSLLSRSSILQAKGVTKPISKSHLCETTSSAGSLSVRLWLGGRNHTGMQSVTHYNRGMTLIMVKRTLNNSLGLRKTA